MRWAWVMVLALAAPRLAVAQESCRRFGEPRETGALQAEALKESSGLAASFTQAGVYFTHNDSGDGPRLFAINAAGQALAELEVAGAEHEDWEDIAMGPCAAGSCLFIGDVGDNGRRRAHVTVYRVPEPKVGAGSETQAAVQLDLRYPDGARDVEALLVDPRTGDLFLVEKTEASQARVVVLRGAGRAVAGDHALTALGTVEATPLVTGGDFEPLGAQAVLRDYGSEALRYAVTRDAAGQVTGFVLLDHPSVGLLGEAIAYRADGLALLTTREGVGTTVEETPCLEPDGRQAGAAVGPLAEVATSAPERRSGGCRGGAALAPLLLLLGGRRRRWLFGAARYEAPRRWGAWLRRRAPWLALAVLLPAAPARAAEHHVYAALAGEVWPTPAGGHGVALLTWRALQAPGGGTFELTLNTDTLAVTYRDLCAGRLCFGAELKGEALIAGLLPDYFARGQKVAAGGFNASYVAGAAFGELRLAPAYLRYTATVRKWFFKTAEADFVLPQESVVVEQELAATYWAFTADPSLYEPHRLSWRTEGLGVGVRLGVDARLSHDPWGLGLENDPAQVILRVRQWARYGVRLADRLRWQVEERFAWGRGEDDLTRDRVGGMNPYVTPLGGVPWAAFVLGDYVAGRTSLHVRVYDEIEAGAFFDALAAPNLERDGSRRVGGAIGTGGFVDMRWGAWQADLWVGWAPGLSWSVHRSHVAGWLALGYRFI
ncbi:MAG: hypothetical protein KC933_02230 [Myxococcales bacterium]|nr:hypothetical protein [Myxococcales bacterium]MCB9651345.1 hypothetical protein [Deltaproteobacteria bacterium]